MGQLYSLKGLVDMWIDNNEFALYLAPELGMVLFEEEWDKEGRLIECKFYHECKIYDLLTEEQHCELFNLEDNLDKIIEDKYIQYINCAMDYLVQEINYNKIVKLVSDFKNHPNGTVYSTIDKAVSSYIVKRKEEYPELYLEVML